MGLDINAVRFLIDARKRGVDFGEVITLGRQDLNVFPAKMVEVLEAHGGCNWSPFDATYIIKGKERFFSS